MQHYVGMATAVGCQVFTWNDRRPDRPEQLPLCLELWNHSPDGFNWGHGGSGPAQLSLALLYHITKDRDFAISFHQDLKARLIAALPPQLWELSEVRILQVCLEVARTPQANETALFQLNACKARIRLQGEQPRE